MATATPKSASRVDSSALPLVRAANLPVAGSGLVLFFQLVQPDGVKPNNRAILSAAQRVAPGRRGASTPGRLCRLTDPDAPTMLGEGTSGAPRRRTDSSEKRRVIPQDTDRVVYGNAALGSSADRKRGAMS